MAKRCDAAFLGIGTDDPQYSALVRAGFITEEQSLELHRQGAVGMAVGEPKIKAILGAIRGRYINSLVTDEKTAEYILMEDEKTSVSDT